MLSNFHKHFFDELVGFIGFHITNHRDRAVVDIDFLLLTGVLDSIELKVSALKPIIWRLEPKLWEAPSDLSINDFPLFQLATNELPKSVPNLSNHLQSGLLKLLLQLMSQVASLLGELANLIFSNLGSDVIQEIPLGPNTLFSYIIHLNFD